MEFHVWGKALRWLTIAVLMMGTLMLTSAVSADEMQQQGSSLSDFLNTWSKSNTGRYALIPQSRTDDGAFVLGRADAPITVVEFADFLCIHCQNYEPTVQRFIDAYVIPGKAKFEFRMFPVVNQDTAPEAAQLAECMDTLLPGSFWAARATIFSIASSTEFTADPVDTLTQEFGVDANQLQRCTQTAQQYVVDSNLGIQIGIQSLTAVWVRHHNGDLQNIEVGGQVYEGPVAFSVLSALVDSASA